MTAFLWIMLAVLAVLAAWQARMMIRAGKEAGPPVDGDLPACGAATEGLLKELDGMIADGGTEDATGRPLLCFFSLKMLTFFPCDLRIEEIDRLPGGLVSAVSSPEMASCLHVPCNRAKVRLLPGDTVYVALLHGGQLPQGTAELPEGFGFRYYRITAR